MPVSGSRSSGFLLACNHLSRYLDAAYKAEFDAYISTAKYIEYMTDGNVDFVTAKKLIQTKRAELLQLLAI